MLLERHLVASIIGAGLTWVLYLILRIFEHSSIAVRILAAALLALPAALLLTLINYEVLYAVHPEHVWRAQVLETIDIRGVVARTMMAKYFILVAWATLYTSVSSALETQEAERRAAVFQADSRSAELRALRYQLNPHFLFNALNTISALVISGDADGAENTIHALSHYLRSALAADPAEDATLADELELQQLYLEIEQVRFGDRLRVQTEVPDALRSALLPPMLLQPLVENAIRHAVAPSPVPVTLTITARAGDDGLHVLVEDDGCGAQAPIKTGIGLRNAVARLSTRYGDAARCEHGNRLEGGYRAELVLPLRMQGAPA